MNESVNLVYYWRDGSAHNELANQIRRTKMLVKTDSQWHSVDFPTQAASRNGVVPLAYVVITQHG